VLAPPAAPQKALSNLLEDAGWEVILGKMYLRKSDKTTFLKNTLFNDNIIKHTF